MTEPEDRAYLLRLAGVCPACFQRQTDEGCACDRYPKHDEGEDNEE